TAGGVLLTLSGHDFGLSGASVSVGGQSCMTTLVTDTTVVCTLQEGVGRALPVVVSVGGQSSTQHVTFDYAAPTLSGIQPDHAPMAGGTHLTLTGSNFGAAGATVNIGGAACVVGQQTPTSIFCDSPAGTGTRDVMVTLGNQDSNPRPFHYDAPRFDSVTPDH